MSRTSWMKRAAVAGMATLLASTPTAWGQQVNAVSQVLEEVLGIGSDFVLRVESNDPTVDFSQLDVIAADIRACSLTAKGLFCLVGNDIYLWSDVSPLMPPDPATNPGIEQFSCRNGAFNLDTKKDNTCTSMTANPAGNIIVIGGKDKGKAYSAHIVQKCDDPNRIDGLSSLDDPEEDYCQDQLATGRPLIVDMWTLPVDSNLGVGTVVLEQRKDATIIRNDGSIEAGPSGKSDWGLDGNEQLLGLATIKLDEVAFPEQAGVEFFVATTTKGRILVVSSDAAATPSNFEVFDIQIESRDAQVPPLTPIDLCDTDDPQFGIRSGFKSGLVYVTDREYCQLLVLEPVATGSPISEGPFDLTLQEALPTGSEFPPSSIAVAPGINLDLLTCGENAPKCTVIPDSGGNNQADAEYIGVQLIQDSPSGVTIFQIKNGPDCRYDPEACVGLEQFSGEYDAFLNGADPSPENAVNFLVGKNVIQLAPDEMPGCWLTTVADCNPGGWRLNVTPLLPEEITSLFEDSEPPPDGLPELLFSRQYRAQKLNDFRWEALFAVLEEGVIFDGTFEAFYENETLVTSGNGFSYGCNSLPTDLADALAFDAVTTVSETYPSGLSPEEYRDWLTNFDCGSSRSSKKSLSLDAYNLEITPCTVAYPDDVVWESDGVCGIGGAGEVDSDQFIRGTEDDAVFFKLALSLWDDYGAMLSDFACQPNDPPDQAGAPLLSSNCTTLESGYLNTTDKFEKCWDALRQPKQSAGDQTCQAFESQLKKFESDLAVAIQNAPANVLPAFVYDPANRTGELDARLKVFRFLLDTRVFPIEPPDGYCEPESSCSAP